MICGSESPCRGKTATSGKAGRRSANIAAWLAALLIAAATDSPVGAQDTKVFQFALQNGLSVLVVPDHRAPIVTQMLWYRVGATDDPPGYSGLAHFFEHMMFRGTASMPGDQFARTVARNGGDDDAFTTQDYTAFYEQIAKDRLRFVMGLDADRMINLDLSESNVRTNAMSCWKSGARVSTTTPRHCCANRWRRHCRYPIPTAGP